MARFSFYDFAGLEKDGSGTSTYPKPGFSYPPQWTGGPRLTRILGPEKR